MKRSKFNNVRTEIDGRKFDSKGESQRYLVLKQRLEDGLISDLRLQTPFVLAVNGTKIATYRADFVYLKDGVEIVEDFKSLATITSIYRLKKKLMSALHGITIKETFKADDD